MNKKNDKNEIINENRDIIRRQIFSACDNANKSSTDYSNFLTTIASISLGLSPLMVQIMIGDRPTINFGFKILFIISLSLVFASLLFGMIHSILEKKFYEKWSDVYLRILGKWNDVAMGKISSEEAERYENDVHDFIKTKSSTWPLILQSIFCFVGFLGLLIIISVIVMK